MGSQNMWHNVITLSPRGLQLRSSLSWWLPLLGNISDSVSCKMHKDIDQYHHKSLWCRVFLTGSRQWADISGVPLMLLVVRKSRRVPWCPLNSSIAWTTNEGNDITMVHHAERLHIAQNQEGIHGIKFICDDTDVFFLLMHFCYYQNLMCSLIMEATSSCRVSVDIQAWVKQKKKAGGGKDIVPHILAAHGPSSCDRVVKLHGNGKGTVINWLKEGVIFQH